MRPNISWSRPSHPWKNWWKDWGPTGRSLISIAEKWKRLRPVPGFAPILMPLKPTSSSHRVPAEEVSEALHQRTGSDLRSARDPEGHSSTMERARLRHRPPYARRSPGRREPYHQSQAVPAAALPPSKRWSSYIQNKSILEPSHALQPHRPPPALQPPRLSSEEPKEVKSGHGRAPP